MQEGTVEWDPQYMTHDPGWAIRIYILYTFFAALYVAVKSIGIFYALWFRRAEKNESSDQLAKAALKGKVPAGVVSQSVASTFDYLAANIDADIRSMMRCSAITFISSITAFAIGLINTLHGVSYAKAAGVGAAISGGVSESLISAVLGLIVGLGAFFMASVFESRLARNRAKWN